MAKRSKLPSGNIDGWKFNWLTHPAAARGWKLTPEQAYQELYVAMSRLEDAREVRKAAQKDVEQAHRAGIHADFEKALIAESQAYDEITHRGEAVDVAKATLYESKSMDSAKRSNRGNKMRCRAYVTGAVHQSTFSPGPVDYFGRPLPPDQAKHWVPPHKHTKDCYTKYGELVCPESKGSGGW